MHSKYLKYIVYISIFIFPHGFGQNSWIFDLIAWFYYFLCCLPLMNSGEILAILKIVAVFNYKSNIKLYSSVVFLYFYCHYYNLMAIIIVVISETMTAILINRLKGSKRYCHSSLSALIFHLIGIFRICICIYGNNAKQ